MSVENNEHQEFIGKVEKTRDSEREKELEDFILNSNELQNGIDMLEKDNFSDEDFIEMMKSWNDKNTEWAGGGIEKKFTSAKGQVLKVKMDYQGHVQLSGTFENQETSKDFIGKLEKTKDSNTEEVEKNLNALLYYKQEMKDYINNVEKGRLSDEEFFEMIKSWNDKNYKEDKWVGNYVNKKFKNKKGQVLEIRMDRNNNVQLVGTIETEK